MAGLTLRRSRVNRHLRDLVREVRVHPGQFIQPLFVVEGLDAAEPVRGLTDVNRDTPDSLLVQVERDLAAGLTRFLLFGVPRQKAERDFAHDFTAGQVRALKARFGDDIWLATDVCLCSHTVHGHCGVLNDGGTHVLNDATVQELARAALAHAAAGADCVAPSDMMDGRVGAIRAALDGDDLEQVAIMSYATKFRSAFYGPFREAADSAPAAGARLRDRATYQLDPARRDDALRCALRDADEGADVLMVKPGLPCLDLLATLSAEVPLPWAVYQVSGEQAALELLAREGLVERDEALLEAWTAFARAGARIIISYAARSAPRVLAR